MKLYESIAQEMAERIQQGLLQAGERINSVREMSLQKNVSISTVLQAYRLLEKKAFIISKPQSGYYVAAQAKNINHHPVVTKPRSVSTRVDVGQLVFELMSATKNTQMAPIGSPFPSPELFPLKKLNQYTRAIGEHYSAWQTISDITPGNEALREQIAKRYQNHGYSLTKEDITITSGGLEAIHLSLQAVCKPGDTVVVESPCVYAILQSIELLGLKAIEISTSTVDGVDLNALTKTLKEHRVAACVLMPNFQNPLGSLMPNDKKKTMVALLAAYQIPLIEDDVCQELYFDAPSPKSAKFFDESGLVLHCGSFSKSLAPGYQVGWLIAGKFQHKINQLKCLSNLTVPSLLQMTLAEYIQHENFDHHLKKLRHTLEIQQAQLIDLLDQYFPQQTKITKPKGGYTLWVELTKTINTTELFYKAMKQKIIIAPGCIFSAKGHYKNCLRMNYAYPINDTYRQAIKRLATLMHSS